MKGETDARVEMPSEIKILGMAESQTEFREQLAQGARLLHAGKMDEALPHLLRARELEPQNADAALNLSGAYLMSGRFKLALPILEEAVAHSPGNARLWINLGAAQLGNPITATDERQKKALEAFNRALELDPAAPSVAYNMGLIHRDRGEREQAIAARRAAQSDPGDKDAKSLLEKLEKMKDAEGGPSGTSAQ